MSRINNQRRLFLELIEELRPWWRSDPGLPQRLNNWLVAHRAGGRDRRLYRELAYTAWRILPWIENAPPDELVRIVANHAQPSKSTADFIAEFSANSSADLAPESDPTLLPDWLATECPTIAGQPAQKAALLQRAPLWIRLQTDRADAVAAEFRALGIEFTVSSLHPDAWQIIGEANVTASESFRHGRFEVQDIGSQALLLAAPIQPGQSWLDACAGAGGKSLQLARLLGPRGRVIAHDIRAKALEELALRARRADIRTIAIERSPSGEFDGVLVDAPCSGSGTWRRAPHLKWTTSSETIRASADRQKNLLSRYAAHVKSDGLLIYATCSICRRENEEVADWFLSRHPEFQSAPLNPPPPREPLPNGQWAILPADFDSDGYFVAAFRRQPAGGSSTA